MSFEFPSLVRNAGLVLAFFVIAGQATSTALAQAPPVNDGCSGAFVIPAAGPFPHLTPISLDITGAATNGDPEFPSCGSTISRSIWYKFTPDATASYVLSVCDDTATTVLDTVMAIYQSSSDCAGSLTEVACNDDACDLRSGIVTSLTRNRTYYILVWLNGADAPPPGETAIQLRVSKLSVPANDVCSGAITIPPNGPFPHLTAMTDLTLATTNGDPPPPSCQPNLSSSAWYRFTPSTTGVYRISTCAGETGTTLKDSVMAVYRSAGCGGPFVPVACNDDECGTQAALSVSLRAGTNYSVVVWVYDVAGPPIGGTDVQLRIARILAPTITAAAASNVTPTAATLYALINPREGNTLAGFEWGTSTNYGNASALEIVSAGAGDVGVGVELTGLSPATTYHFRALATNEAGIVLGSDSTFTSAAPPNLSSSRILANGAFEFQFTGFAGTVYTVLSSSNLVNWAVLGTATSLEGGLFHYQDRNANLANRFYRITAP